MRVGDFRTYVEGFSPATRGECVCEIYWFIAMAHHGELGEADVTELNGIFWRHGLDELRATPDPPGTKRPMREAIARVRDPAAFYADAMRFLEKRRMGWGCGGIDYWLRFDPQALRVQGDRATAIHAVVGTVTFERLDGAWFVRSPMNCIRNFDGEPKNP